MAGYASAPGQQAMDMGGPPQGYGQPVPPQHYGQVVVDLNPWNHLNQMTSAKIKERVTALEALIGWEQNNIYDIFDQNGGSRFIAKEDTDCLTRQCVPPCLSECRKFEFDVSMVPLPGQTPPSFIHAKRPCTCTCFCLNRPTMEIMDKTSGAPMGIVENPWRCCDYDFVMKTAQSEKAVQVKGGCCQAGIWCPLPCGSCKEVHFQVLDFESKKEIGHMKRVIPGCCKFCISDADNYEVEFGEITDAKWKAMLLATAIFIDFRYFSQGKPAPGVGGGD